MKKSIISNKSIIVTNITPAHGCLSSSTHPGGRRPDEPSVALPRPPRAREQQIAVQPRAALTGRRTSHHITPAKPMLGHSAYFFAELSHDFPFGCRSFGATMSEGAVTIRTKKFITNRLLQRKQFVRRALVHTPHLSASSSLRSPTHRSFSRRDSLAGL